MFQAKQNSSVYLPIRFYDTVTNASTTGVGFSTITITVEKADGTIVAVTIVPGSWSEIVSGAFAGSGNYTYLLANTYTNVVGRLRYAVTTSSPATTSIYTGVIDIVADLASDVMTTLGTPAGASVSADIAQVEGHAASADTNTGTILTRIGSAGGSQPGDLFHLLGNPSGGAAGSVSADIATINTTTGTSSTNISTLLAIGFGKWQIFTTGPDANRLVLYALDGVTVLKKFALKDSNGAPTTASPFERDPL